MAALVPMMAGAQATVSGDVYAVNGAGELLRGAGSLVSVLPDSPQTLAVMGRLCEASKKDNLRTIMAMSDMTAHSSDPSTVAMRAQIDTLSRAALDTVRADVNGHYELELSAGDYLFTSRIETAGTVGQWWKRVTVPKSGHVRADLSPVDLNSTALFCFRVP